MNFVYKCYLQSLFSLIPRGEKLNYFFQKYVTNSLPVSNERFLKKITTAKEHFDIFTKYSQSENNKNVNYYEFGAGWDLINPIGLSLLGMQTLKCIDIRKLIFPSLLNDTISKLYLLKEKISFDYSLPESIPSITISNFRSILMEYFRINYDAPLDARYTDFQDSTIDFIASNVTFEHIPAHDLGSILRECHRVLKKGGILSARIDYQDHWSYFDHSISIYNFLKYSPDKWQRYNPSLHYQNRLRHKDYLNIISQTDFEILLDNPKLPSFEEMDQLRKLQIDASLLNKYTLEELSVKGSRIVLRK